MGDEAHIQLNKDNRNNDKINNIAEHETLGYFMSGNYTLVSVQVGMEYHFKR